VLIPCIDLQGGQAVQLVHGRKRELAVRDVFGLLEKFKRFEWLHVIDLDAAMGRLSNASLVRKLCACAKERYGMKIRVGGGIRTIARASTAVKCGAQQIIVGSSVFRDGQVNFAFLQKLRAKVGARKIVIALDTFRGKITTHGWRQQTAWEAAEIMPQLEPFCAAFLCTDVDREGTMSGANLKWFRELRRATKHPIIAAGGIKTLREVAALRKMKMDAAVGMAMYKNVLK
jgi:phosphoribosylformimino-5-aminoimidazole carboxamide ribotide isomerase